MPTVAGPGGASSVSILNSSLSARSPDQIRWFRRSAITSKTASGDAVDVTEGCVRNPNGRSAIGGCYSMRAQPGLHPLQPRGGHNPRVTGTEPPVDPRSEHAASDVQIRTFLIADVRGYTLFTQERGDEAAAKLAAKFADMVREVVEARGGILLELRGDEALCVFSSPGSDPDRGQPATAVRRGDPRTAGAPPHGRDRPRCRRGGRGSGWVPRRRA